MYREIYTRIIGNETFRMYQEITTVKIRFKRFVNISEIFETNDRYSAWKIS